MALLLACLQLKQICLQRSLEKVHLIKDSIFQSPYRFFFTNFRQGDISFGLHPLTKDGGALLNNVNSLYALYGDTNKNSVSRDWKSIND